MFGRCRWTWERTALVMQASRVNTLKLAVRGLRNAVLDRGNPGGSLTECNTLEVIHNAINRRLASALDEWERTGSQPDWDQVLGSIPTDGEAYIGPSGGWIEFGVEMRRS